MSKLKFWLFSYLSCQLIVGSVAAGGHWTPGGPQRSDDQQSQESSTIEWSSYPSTFSSDDIAAVPRTNYRRIQDEAPSNGRTFKRTENVSIRYWDHRIESFKTLDVPVYRKDSIGDLAKRAAEMTGGAIPPETAG